MICPNCSSTSLHGPRYGSIPGGYRRAAVMSCQSCRSVFDAYEMYGGNGRAVRRDARLAA